MPETVTASLFVSPCIHLQVTEEDLQDLGRVIDDLHHIVGGSLYAFGKGGGGVVLVGLLLSGLFLLGLLLDIKLGGLRLGFGVILAAQKHLIGGLFVLLRLLRFGGLLLVLLLLVLLLLILRGQQLLSGGLIALVLAGLSSLAGLSTSSEFSPVFSTSSEFSSAAFRLSVGLVLSPVMMMSSLSSSLFSTVTPPTVIFVPLSSTEISTLPLLTSQM